MILQKETIRTDFSLSESPIYFDLKVGIHLPLPSSYTRDLTLIGKGYGDHFLHELGIKGQPELKQHGNYLELYFKIERDGRTSEQVIDAALGNRKTIAHILTAITGELYRGVNYREIYEYENASEIKITSNKN